MTETSGQTAMEVTMAMADIAAMIAKNGVCSSDTGRDVLPA
jgi:hypothetical protein